MDKSNIEALSGAWAQAMAAVDFPQGYDGEPTPEAHRAACAIEEKIREHIVSSGDMRLFSLMHLLGQASLRMEQELYPEYDKWFCEQVEEGLKEADDPNTQWVPNEVAKEHFAAKRKALAKAV